MENTNRSVAEAIYRRALEIQNAILALTSGEIAELAAVRDEILSGRPEHTVGEPFADATAAYVASVATLAEARDDVDDERDPFSDAMLVASLMGLGVDDPGY